MQSKVELEAVNNDFKLLNIQAEQLRQRLKKVSQCEERLDKYLQMETQMRENVAILEHESAQIINLIQEK